MTLTEGDANTARAVPALKHQDSSIRLQAAMAVATTPEANFIATLIERCAIEPDFSVREMLTWALTRHSAELTIPQLVDELGSGHAQARSPALHTLSKIGDRSVWPAITHAHLTASDDEVARAAWRTAVALRPEGADADLAAVLISQLGRGERETQLSLSRSLIELGEDAITPALRVAMKHNDPLVQQHAATTEWLLHHPENGFESAIYEAKRVFALTDRPAD